MGQFVFGLFAGIVVGLVMEWIIDWAGLFPDRSIDKSSPKNASAKTTPKVPRTAKESNLNLTSHQNTSDTSRD